MSAFLRAPERQEAEMAENDVLSQMLDAWRDDVESVPFPQFSELLIPRQQIRPLAERRCTARPSVARVTNATQGTDA